MVILIQYLFMSVMIKVQKIAGHLVKSYKIILIKSGKNYSKNNSILLVNLILNLKLILVNF